MSTYYSTETSQSMGQSAGDFEHLSATIAESECGAPIPEPADQAYWANCICFGRRFFEFVLTWPTGHTGKTSATQLNNLIGRFKYAQCLEKVTSMPEFELIPDTQHRVAKSREDRLMANIGALILHGGDNTSHTLASIIQACRSDLDSAPRNLYGLPAHAAGSPSPPRSDVSDEPETIVRDGAGRSPNFGRRNTNREMMRRDEPRLGSYASRLKEHLDVRHEHMDQPPATQVAEVQPEWRQTIRLQGRTFEGRAPTKKEAFHIACRDACLEFGL